MTEDEIFEWHHRLNGHKFEQTLGDRKGQGGLVHCSPWDSKELDTTYRLKNNRQKKFKQLPLIVLGKDPGIAVCCCLIAKLCPTVCDPKDCSPSGSSVRGISQARILERVAISFFRGSS